MDDADDVDDYVVDCEEDWNTNDADDVDDYVIDCEEDWNTDDADDADDTDQADVADFNPNISFTYWVLY